MDRISPEDSRADPRDHLQPTGHYFQGLIAGAKESLNGREKIVRRKVKKLF